MTPSLDERIAAHAARNHGLVTRPTIVELGGTAKAIRHRIERHRLVVVQTGVYRIAGAPRSWHADVLALVLSAGEDACASHRTAAALFAIPGFGHRHLEIAVPRGRRPRLPRASVHHLGVLPEHHRRVVDGIPVTSVARTVFDLCGCVHPARAERALDHCLARRMVTIPSCWRVLYDLAERGRPGTAWMRVLLQARGEGYVAPASKLEQTMLTLIRDELRDEFANFIRPWCHAAHVEIDMQIHPFRRRHQVVFVGMVHTHELMDTLFVEGEDLRRNDIPICF